jgi:hypothetical protein
MRNLQKRPDSTQEPQNKPANQSPSDSATDDHPIRTLRAVFTGYAIWCAFAGLCLVPFLEIMRASPRFLYLAGAGLSLAISALIMIATHKFVRSKAEEQSKNNKLVERAFSVVRRAHWISDSRDKKPNFWFVSDGGDVVYPIHNAMHAAFTNLKPYPVTIDYYTVESEISPGKWNTMPRVEARTGTLYIGDMKGAGAFKIVRGGIFDSEIEGKAVPSQETVLGMIFLETPKEGIGTKWRMRVRNTRGEEFTEEVEDATKSDEWSVQRLTFEALGVNRDLTALKLKYWSEPN